MKVTKKARKKANGMNAITKIHFKWGRGHRVPIYNTGGQELDKPLTAKLIAGVPYVNELNFI